MLYTRNGDKGTSKLFGSKECIPKNDPIYVALGTIDELCSYLGVCRAYSAMKKSGGKISACLFRAQNNLFIVQAELAGAPKSIPRREVESLEKFIDQIENSIVPPTSFIIPGSVLLSAMLDFSRALSRRAERTVVAVKEERKIGEATLEYLNRLSSLLYALARFTAAEKKVREIPPTY